MNPQMFGTLPTAPKVSELWNNEPNKYRLWMIIFSVTLFITVGLLIANFVWSFVDKDNIIANYIANYQGDKAMTHDQALSLFERSVAFQAIELAGIIAAFIWFLVSLTEGYRKKTFANLSYYAILLVQIVSFIGIVQIFFLIFSGAKVNTDNLASLFAFISQFVFIPLWFSAIVISRIRRRFAFSKYVEERANDPNYQAMVQQVAEFSKFQNNQPQSGAKFTSTQPNQTNATKGTPVPTNEQSQERIELMKLKVGELRKIANKLSISGSATMKKNELISAILRITS